MAKRRSRPSVDCATFAPSRRSPSSIERLPDDVLERLQELLRDKRVTQLEVVAKINALLAEAGYAERISKSALNRYALRMEEVGAKLRQSREVAEMWIARLGSTPGGQVGHLVNEMVRSMAFELSMTLQEGQLDPETMPETVDMLKGLALTMQRLEAASNMNVKREQAIRKQALEAAAKTVGETAREAGVSADTIERIRRDVLRMSA